LERPSRPGSNACRLELADGVQGVLESLLTVLGEVLVKILGFVSRQVGRQARIVRQGCAAGGPGGALHDG